MRSLPLLALAACSNAYVAVETERADLRVFAILDAPPRVEVRAGAEPLRLDLAPIFDRGADLELWTFGFSLADLAAAYPEYAGKSAQDLVPLLAPSLGPSERGEPPAPRFVSESRIGRDLPREVVPAPRDLAAWKGRAAALGLALTMGPPARGCEGVAVPSFERFEIEGAPSARFAVPLADGAVLIGGEPDFLARVERDLRVTTLAPPPGLPLHAAASDDGRTVWFGGLRLARAVVTTTIAEVRELGPPPGGRIFRLAADRDAVYTLSGDGRFDRYDPVGWVSLHRFLGANTYSGIEVLGPDHAVVVSAQRADVVRWRDGRGVLEPLIGADSGISAIGRAAGLGAVASPSVERTLFTNDGATWRELEASRTGVLACGLAALGGGVLVVGQSGQGAWFVPGRGVCFADTVANATQHFLAPFEGGLLMVGDASSRGLLVTIARP